MKPNAIVKSFTCHSRELGRCHFLYNSAIFQKITPDYFLPSYWQQTGKITGFAKGRGTTWFFQHQEFPLVLRHYYRGGLIGKWVNDAYLFTGLKSTRAFAEFNLLVKMFELGLPVPQPTACAVYQRGLTYRADIITSRITDAKDLVALLTEGALDIESWQQVGQMIAQFHQQGVNHHDLNCHNILRDSEGKFWLIDFDQGKIQTPVKSWQQQNLDRLQRSFIKEKNRLANFHWQSSNWQELLSGYNAVINS